MVVGPARIVHLSPFHSILFQPLLPAEERLQKHDPVFHEKGIANTTLVSLLFKLEFKENILIPCRMQGDNNNGNLV